ncbi:myosin type V [Schizosaccharomyces pombe]|uniref:Myosin-52 n=1 Tax=Schizosaccharomyces pombe (strain 972 / ATCC 24843) TaxID=284812 RepID=MYO52_SCHPO|nr:myosin type V [Schizosaccharomyces pombe]O94477.1 RecName: Full=Myosin-52; AltName: Full=Myosin type V-2 [Schizosaccharomyces pombe 972h-]CAA22641.1 myosin type V [Schizosaccharomyces pombe]|eukprot:NP_588492.1 myosin type V [Schizosaccharomyces pombe]
MTSGIYYKGLQCWIPDEQSQWIPGSIKDCRVEGEKAFLTVQDENENETVITVKPDDLNYEGRNGLPFLRSINSDADDLTDLSYLNEPSVLDALSTRYNQLQIYTYSGIVLIAVNPFQRLPNLYTHEIVRAYSEKSRDELDPHLYAIAEDSYKCMNQEHKNQTIIISGESGAGKTVSARYIMRYFASVQALIQSTDSNFHEAPQLTAVENEILATNPIMEAFGNSKTSRNDNSSRFGKYIQILFDGNATIIGAKIQTYLLERSRLVFQPNQERNYHIFYQILAGSSSEQLEKWKLVENSQEFNYLKQGNCSTIEGVNDKEEFKATVDALKTVGIDNDTCECIFSLLAALLHIGNIEVKHSRNDAYIDSKNENLINATSLLGVDPSSLVKWLTKRKIKMASEGILKPLNEFQAVVARDSVAKFLYASLFDWLVATINKALMYSADKSNQTAKSFIGVLDIYGFEHFKKNSFEQFCINYANEKLQQEFYRHVFKLEQEEYAAEGLNWSYIDYQDNQQCISMIESRLGILSLLDEECRMPTNSDENWVSKLNDAFSKPEFKNSYQKSRFGNKEFTIKHYALDVVYCAEGFIDKNRDTISDELLELFTNSDVPFVKDLVLFRLEQTAPPADTKKIKTKPKSNTLGSMFKSSLVSLMSTINETNAHYIRCIKPNEEKEAWKFDNQMVVSQLRACGVLETIKISCAGFPSRWTFDEFVSRYYMLVPSAVRTTESLTFSKAILEKHADPTKYQIGKTKIFFRSGVTPLLESARDKALKHAAHLLYEAFAVNYYRTRFLLSRKRVRSFQAVAHGFLSRRHTEYELLSSNIIKLQSLWRTALKRKEFIQTKNSILKVQSIIRGFLLRQTLEEKTKHDATLIIQSLWLTFKAHKHYKELQYYAVRIQSLWRMKLAKRQLTELKIESTKASHLKQVSYRLESRLFEISKQLDNSEQENNKFRERIAELESHLSNYAEAKLAQERELEQTRVLISDQSQDGELKELLEEKENALIMMEEEMRQVNDANTELLRVNATLKSQLKNYDMIIVEQTSQLKEKNRIIASLTKATKILNSASSIEQSRNSEEKSRRDSSLMEMRTQKEMLVLLMNDGLKHDLDKLTEYAGRTFTTLKTLLLKDNDVEAQKLDHLFLAKLLFIIISQMWKSNLCQESVALVERYCVHTLEYVFQKTSSANERPDIGFWVANTHALLAFVYTKQQAFKHSSAFTLLSTESHESVQTIFEMIESHLSKIFFEWVRQVNNFLKPLIVQAMIITGTNTDAGDENRKLRIKFFEKPKYKITDVIHVLNKVHDSCQAYKVNYEIYNALIRSIYRFINVEAFNSLFIDERGSWKRGTNISYNYHVLKDWCLESGVPEAYLQLEELLQTSKILQFVKDDPNYVARVRDFYALNFLQIKTLLHRYDYADYEAHVPKKTMSELSKNIVAEGINQREQLTYEVLDYRLQDSFEESPSLEKIKIPDDCNVTYLRRIIDLASAEESVEQALITVGNVADNDVQNSSDEENQVPNGIKV